MSPIAWERAFQIALRKCLKRGRVEGQYIRDFGEAGVHVIKHRFLQKVSASLTKLSLMFSCPPLFSQFSKIFYYRNPHISVFMGFPGGSDDKESACNARRKWQPTPVFLPGKSHGRRSLVGYSPWGYKNNWATNTFISIFITLTCGNTFVDVSTYLKLKQTNRCSRWTQVFRGERWCMDMRDEIQEFWLTWSRSSGGWAAGRRGGGFVWLSWEPSLTLSDSDQGSCTIGTTSHGWSPFAGTVYLSVCPFTYLATSDSVCTFVVFISCFI